MRCIVLNVLFHLRILYNIVTNKSWQSTHSHKFVCFMQMEIHALYAHTLKKATGDCTVEYIALEDKTAKTAGEKVLCYRVLPQMIFEVPLASYSASVHVAGAAVQIHTDGLRLGAAAASGLSATTTAANSTYTTKVSQKTGAVIVDTEGAAAANDKVLVRLA